MRRDKDGNLRELHVDKAMKVSSLTPYEPQSFEDGEIIGKCKYFVTKKQVLDGTEKIFKVTDASFLLLTAVSGCGSLSYTDEDGGTVCISISAGDSYFAPAGSGELTASGNMTLITVQTP